ncbi:MAG: iron-containing alcohol dehydrogenase, partial [bacterium]
MSKQVHVKLGSRSYDILIGRNVTVGTSLKRRAGLKAMIVSDSNVDPLYGPRCERSLRAKGFETIRVTVPAGESSKSGRMVMELYNKAAELHLDRSSCIVALGGGVVGDLAGFIAATFLRGINFIQVPTSLLAMVDSSVGGKTGINLKQGKNLVGAFYQPVEVTADLSVLKTLPRREYVSGLAEVVKYGVIRDAAFFRMLEKNADRLLRRDSGLLEEVVARCCEIKAAVVSVDEREEGGERAVLNFGHTFGHALGDQALTKAIQAVCAQLRTSDIIGRYGGDEFIILLPQTSAQEALPLAERIHASIAAMRIETDSGPLNLTISIGIAET